MSRSTKGHAGAQPALGCAAPAFHGSPHLLHTIHLDRLQAMVGTGQAQRAVGCVAVLGTLGKLFVGGGGHHVIGIAPGVQHGPWALQQGLLHRPLPQVAPVAQAASLHQLRVCTWPGLGTA